MATTIKKSTPKTNKKDLELEIVQKLEAALDSYKAALGDKKFKNRIKKASKLFLKGKPKKAPVKKAAPAAKKKTVTKVTKKPAQVKK